MAVSDIVRLGSGRPVEETLASASPDLLREMIKGFAQRMMDAEVQTLCGAAYGEVSPERMNSRNGYRRREWDIRAGTMSCDQVIFVYQATGASLSLDAVPPRSAGSGSGFSGAAPCRERCGRC